MFSVYVNKFNPIEGSETLGDGDVESLLFTIPNQNGDIRPFLSMTVKDEMGNAGSAEFSVDAKSPFYNIWRHMRTLVRVEYDGYNIFYGRVLTIDRDMFRTKKIHCEGAMTFFMDSLYEGTKAGVTTTLGDFLGMLVSAHNECMASCPEKKVQLGEVPGHYSAHVDEDQKIKNDTQKFGAEQGFKSVKEHLDSLISDYAGHMKIRYLNGVLYLDWLKNYFNPDKNNQLLSVSQNTIDLSDTVEVDNIFTHVIPIGKNHTCIDAPQGGGAGTGKYAITCKRELDPDPGEWVTTGMICLLINGKTYLTSTRANPGDTVKYSITTDPHSEYVFKGWKFSGVSNYSGGEFKMPENDVTITAAFSKYEVTVDPDAGIDV